MAKITRSKLLKYKAISGYHASEALIKNLLPDNFIQIISAENRTTKHPK